MNNFSEMTNEELMSVDGGIVPLLIVAGFAAGAAAGYFFGSMSAE